MEIDEKALAHAFYKFDTCIPPGEVYSVNAHKYGRAIEKAITAYLSALEERGMVIVPVEPTEAMFKAGHEAFYTDPYSAHSNVEFGAVWDAMLASARKGGG